MSDRYSLPQGRVENATCREAVMTHFQGWKHEYTSFTTSQPPVDAHATVITQTGFIYLKVGIPRELPNLPTEAGLLRTYGEILGSSIWSGRLVPSDLQGLSVATLGLGGYYIPRLLGNPLLRAIGQPGVEYLADKNRQISLNSELEISTDYCAFANDKLSACSCYLLGSEITILKTDSTVTGQGGVTLVTVGWADEVADGGADSILSSFGDAAINKVVP